MREKISFDSSWYFHLGDFPDLNPAYKGAMYLHAKTERALWGPASVKYDGLGWLNTGNWKSVELPHDYIIEQVPQETNNDTLGYFKYENAWYRKNFKLEAEDENRRITLLFEGVATHATVYVNGSLMCHNFSGYNSFEVDITDVAKFGSDNVAAVYVDTSEHEGWWYEGAGIYRHVWLIKTSKTAVDLWGVYANSTKLTGDTWQTVVETTVRNDNFSSSEITLRTELCDADGNVLASDTLEGCLPVKDKVLFVQTFELDNPALWDLDSPNFYYVHTVIEGEDELTTRYAYREIRFDSESGFYLNGKNVKIKGVCCHQDYGLTGKAVPDNIQRYRLRLLKEMGANGYRCSHYMQHEATLDALDELGFLVMAETRWFESTKEGLEQLEMLVKRDRNRPSVIMWSLGNEEPLFVNKQGCRIFETMYAFLKKLDPSRPIMAAVSTNPATAELMNLSDIIGVNYNLPATDMLHEKFPDKPIVSSECCAVGSTRGWYYDTCEKRGYINAYDWNNFSNTGFFAREGTWKFISERKWMMGGYQWAGIEHRGETVWPRLCSQSGALDLYLQKKDAFYQNKSHWTDEPMVHILPHWNHQGREGELISVWVYTNCDEAELILNGESLGTRKIEKHGHGEWQVPYVSGKLTAIAKLNGEAAASESIETTGKPAALKLELQNGNDTRPNGKDLAVVHCFCVDGEGRFVPDASPFVHFNTNRFGKIAGTGSDVCDHVPPSCPDRQMRAGLCAAAVQLGSEKGKLIVYASADGLQSASLEIELQ